MATVAEICTLHCDVEILLVTRDLVEARQLVSDRVHLLRVLDETDSRGSLYREGILWGLAHGFSVLVEMSPDGPHRPQDLELLLWQLTKADATFGSRWTDGARTVEGGLARRLLSRAANTCTRRLLGLPIRDVTGNFRAFRSEALHKLSLMNVREDDPLFQIQLARQAVRAKLVVAEMPITFVERRRHSDIPPSAIPGALKRVVGWALQDRWQSRTRRQGEVRL